MVKGCSHGTIAITIYFSQLIHSVQPICYDLKIAASIAPCEQPLRSIST